MVFVIGKLVDSLLVSEFPTISNNNAFLSFVLSGLNSCVIRLYFSKILLFWLCPYQLFDKNSSIMNVLINKWLHWWRNCLRNRNPNPWYILQTFHFPCLPGMHRCQSLAVNWLTWLDDVDFIAHLFLTPEELCNQVPWILFRKSLYIQVFEICFPINVLPGCFQ